MRNFLLIFIFSALFAGINSIWIGEEYWSIINYDGSIYGGRSINDFIRFKGSEDRFVAYWITQGARVATVVRDECLELIHDTNGDGIVDSKEHHNCRYGKNVCPIPVYDFNKDGLLDEEEIMECLKHLRSAPSELRNPRQSSTVVVNNNNNNNDNQFEAYGEAYIRGDRICAKFVDKDDRATEICGGFRVLSRGSHDGENPFEWYPIREISRHMAVEYLNHQIAQLWNGDRLESVFGGAHMDRGLAYAAFVNNTVLHVGRSSDPHFYDTNIDLLALRDGYFPKQYIHTGPERARRYGTVFTPDDLYANLRRPAAAPVVTDECYNLAYDTNGDGIVDSREHHACRYKKYGCPISVYDFNKDGLLDEDEINECLKHLRSGAAPYDSRNPRTPIGSSSNDECLNLRHDKNADGYINSDELRACRYGIPRCSLSIYDANSDGHLDWNEIEECQRRLPSDRFARFATPYNYKNECGHLRHDRNGDGKIDRHELHLCRYGLIGCSLQVYDADKDGFLDANEIDECKKQLKPRVRHHTDCNSLKHDKNGDGIIDKQEYHACKFGHCSLEIYDLDNDGFLNAHEINECQKHFIPEQQQKRHHCHDLRNDKNGDGIVDRHEYHACRYSGCSLEIYDRDRDGYLNAHEISECYKHRKSDRFVRYCSNLYFDLNKDGSIDSYEMERCLNRHDPSRYEHCSLEIHDLDKNGVLDADEIDECQKRLIPEPHHSSHKFNDCHDLKNDKNGDGIIDKEELLACRYKLVGCNLEIYDLDKDGYLNARETSECYEHLKTDRFVGFCQDLHFDLNKDGSVDTYELEKCLERHDPIQRRVIRSHETAEEEQEAEEMTEEESVQKNQEEEIEEKQDEVLEEKKQEIQELNEEAKAEAEKRKNKSSEEEDNGSDE